MDDRIVQGDRLVLYKGEVSDTPKGILPIFSIFGSIMAFGIVLFFLAMLFDAVAIFFAANFLKGLVLAGVVYLLEYLSIPYRRSGAKYILSKDDTGKLWIEIWDRNDMTKELPIRSFEKWWSDDWSIDFEEEGFIEKYISGPGPKLVDIIGNTRRRITYLFVKIVGEDGTEVLLYEKLSENRSYHWPHKKQMTIREFTTVFGLVKLAKSFEGE